jgi:hypothetical protein
MPAPNATPAAAPMAVPIGPKILPIPPPIFAPMANPAIAPAPVPIAAAVLIVPFSSFVFSPQEAPVSKFSLAIFSFDTSIFALRRFSSALIFSA